MRKLDTEQIRTEGSKFFMRNWLRTREQAKTRRHEARAQPATRSSQRIATQLSQAAEDEALAPAAVGLLNSEEDNDMGEIEEEDSNDEDYYFGDSDHDNDKADEADDDYDYDSDDGRLEDVDDNIGDDEVGSAADASDEDLACAAENTSDGSDDSDYDSDVSEEDPAPPAPRRRVTPINSLGPRTTLGSADAAADNSTTSINTETQTAPQSAAATLPQTTPQKRRLAKQRRNVKYKRPNITHQAPTNQSVHSPSTRHL